MGKIFNLEYFELMASSHQIICAYLAKTGVDWGSDVCTHDQVPALHLMGGCWRIIFMAPMYLFVGGCH